MNLSLGVVLSANMLRHELLFATTNRGKLHEAQGIAEGFGVTLFGLERVEREQSIKAPHVVEGESSYHGNAVIKAKAYAKWSSVASIADDTGVEVHNIGDLPGVFTARFGVDRVRQLLGQSSAAEAEFVCCVAYAEPSGRVVSVTKRLAGRVIFNSMTNSIEGPLPYSAIFIPDGESVPLSQLVIGGSYLSHRGRALTTLFAALGYGNYSPDLRLSSYGLRYFPCSLSRIIAHAARTER